ncbi:hypothetical protein [Nitrincola sp. MINF-07-Sa-05]|uniref:hypothetical protein n=1 Tax=Nitrincola salilacus TaxID=3400273 RepID=UPI003917BB4D
MKPRNAFVLSAGALTIGLSLGAVTNQVYAAMEGNSEYVENVDVDITDRAPTQMISRAPDIIIENKALNKHINALDLKVQGNMVHFEIDGFVQCKKANGVDFMGAWAYFGNVGIGGFGQLVTTGTLHSDKVNVAYTDKAHQIAEATEDTFSVSLANLKNGHPALRIDPLEELEKARQAFNGSDIDFYKQDHEIIVHRPISLGAICGKLNNTDKRSVGFETKQAGIKIMYKGDPAINNNPVLSPQLAGSVPGQVQQNPNLPFQLVKADFMANIPHYHGKCVPDQNPKIRVNFQTGGGKDGLMDMRVKAVSNQYADYGYYFDTQGIMIQANKSSHIDFSFPLKEMLSENKYSYMAISNGTTHNHNMLVQVRYKNQQDGQWSQWQNYDTAVFKHRCTPQVAVPMGGNGGKVGFGSGGNNPPAVNGINSRATSEAADKTINAAPVAPKPVGTINNAPVAPKPAGKINAAPVVPKPAGTLNAAPVAPKPIGTLNAAPVTPKPIGRIQAAPASPRPIGARQTPVEPN